ncbi:MAG: glycosyltransferase family 4 protein [Longimicrobiales bacterium]
MRVLILTQLFPPEPDLKSLPLAKQLKARGHDVEVLTGFPNYPGGRIYDGYSIRPWTRQMVEGVPVTRVAHYPSHDRSGTQRALNYLSFGVAAAALGPWLMQKPDLIYVYNLITLVPAAALLRRLTGAKVVLDVQDLWPQSVESSGMLRSSAGLRVLRRWSDASYSSPDQLFVLSPGLKRHLVERGMPAERVEVIYNWSPENPRPKEAALRAREVGTREGFQVLFAGTMGILQGLDIVVDSARLLLEQAPDVRFTLLGSGVDCERLMQAADGLPNIEFLPRCPPSEVGRILASAEALLVHLKHDPLSEITIPSKLQAYMFAGKPILCGVRGDAAALVAEGSAGINFRPEDAADLCRAVLQLRALPPTRLREMGIEGRRFYEENLSLSRGVDRMEAAFSRLTAS